MRRSQRDKAGSPTSLWSVIPTLVNQRLWMVWWNCSVRVKISKSSKRHAFRNVDTSIRQLTFPDNKQLLLSDTVGLSATCRNDQRLPFSTGGCRADLLIQVIDYADHYRNDGDHWKDAQRNRCARCSYDYALINHLPSRLPEPARWSTVYGAWWGLWLWSMIKAKV